MVFCFGFGDNGATGVVSCWVRAAFAISSTKFQTVTICHGFISVPFQSCFSLFRYTRTEGLAGRERTWLERVERLSYVKDFTNKSRSDGVFLVL